MQPQLNNNGFYSKGHISQVLLTSTQKRSGFHYTKTDTDTLLANKYLTQVMCHYQVIWILVLLTQTQDFDAMQLLMSYWI